MTEYRYMTEQDEIDYRSTVTKAGLVDRLVHAENIIHERDAEIERLKAMGKLAVKLNAMQHSPMFHGFTCGNHSGHMPLIATITGWICNDCEYEQEYGKIEKELTANAD